VLVLLEADYRYGLGTLTLRVERVDRTRPDTYDGATWYRVEGVQVGGNGADIGSREVLVRATRLPVSLLTSLSTSPTSSP